MWGISRYVISLRNRKGELEVENGLQGDLAEGKKNKLTI
jgi:hypothetical protein